MSNFVDVILPLPLPGTFTYSIPEELKGKIIPGCRVVVPFGKKVTYTALVSSLHNDPNNNYEIRPIRELLDEAPIVLNEQIKLWDWIARYYMCSLGEIYKAAIPQGLKGEFKPRTEQRVRLTARCNDEKGINLILQSLSRAPRQKRLLATYLQATTPFNENPKEISKHKL